MPSFMYTAILILASIVCSARASFITFFPPSASQCSDFALNFTGKQISFPITFLLLPLNSSSPHVVELPDTAFDSASNSGTYSTPLPFAAGTQFIAVMHDTRGVGNGGVSPVYTVGGSDKADCLSQQDGNSTLAFSLSPSPPTQCQFQGISWTPLDPNGEGDDLKTVKITGYVPGGLAFRLNVAVDGVTTGSSASWQVSVPQGQDFMFLYERTDPATGTVQRETSPVQNVQPGSDSSCIVQGGPSVTPPAVPPSTSPSATQTSDSTATPGLTPLGETLDNEKGPFGLPKSALIGIIIGAVCLVAILIALLYLFCARRHRKPKLSPLEDGRRTAMSNESRGALMRMDPNAPMGISLPPVRASGFEIDSFYSHGTTAVSAATLPAQGARGPSPDAGKQRGGLLGRIKGRQENENTISVASWGNKGPLVQSTIEVEPEPKPVPVDAMSDISEYSTPDFVPPPPPPAAMAMSRGGSARGRQRVQVEGYYPQVHSNGNGVRPGSSKSRDGGYPSTRDHPPAQTQDSFTSEYSSMGSAHHSYSSSSLVSPLMSPVAGRAPIQNYYPAPVQPPTRAQPLLQRRLSAYEGDNDYSNDGAGSTRSGASMFRPAPDQQFGIAL